MIIGLTGGIASGKSESAKYFKKLGAYVIDADVVSHNLSAKGTPALKELVKSFGRGVLYSNGTLNRKKLGDIIFSNKAAKLKVEKILHSSIISNINEIIAQKLSKYKNIVIDAPLLFEVGLDKICNKVIVVWAPYSIQSKRLALRDGLNEEQIKKRINSQISSKKKIKLADFVIKNISSKEKLKKRTEDLYRLLTSKQK